MPNSTDSNSTFTAKDKNTEPRMIKKREAISLSNKSTMGAIKDTKEYLYGTELIVEFG